MSTDINKKLGQTWVYRHKGTSNYKQGLIAELHGNKVLIMNALELTHELVSIDSIEFVEQIIKEVI